MNVRPYIFGFHANSPFNALLLVIACRLPDGGIMAHTRYDEQDAPRSTRPQFQRAQ
jgi:hypothetical protein